MIELRKETIYVEGDHGRLAMTYTLQAEPAGALGWNTALPFVTAAAVRP